MQNFQDGFEIRKRSFISAFSICMTVPLIQVSFHTIILMTKGSAIRTTV